MDQAEFALPVLADPLQPNLSPLLAHASHIYLIHPSSPSYLSFVIGAAGLPWVATGITLSRSNITASSPTSGLGKITFSRGKS